MSALATKSMFVSGMDKSFAKGKTRTENGAIQLGTSGEALVDLFFNAVRSTPKERLHQLIDACIAALKAEADVEVRAQRAHDLVVAMFQCRATRGMGKGERKLFVHMLVKLHAVWPQTVKSLIREIPFYGCWKDLLEIVAEVGGDKKSEKDKELRKSCLSLFASQMQKDLHTLDAYEKSKGKAPLLSFAGKWAPREKKQFDKKFQVVDDIASYMFPQNVGENASKYTRRKMYRAAVARLCKSLRVPEIYMSSKTWGEIDFKDVPSVCLNKWSKAFLNEKVSAKNDDMDNGNRFPDDEDRVACRKHMIDNLLKGKINGKQLFPHEVVRKCMRGYGSQPSSIDTLLCQAQWDKIRESVSSSIGGKKQGTEVEDSKGMEVENPKGKFDLGKLVPLVDVSGSMSGEPMEVAIALGVLISELAHESFRDRVITFESNPRWHVLNPKDGLKEKVASLQSAPWGGSTSIEKALQLIYHVVRKNKLSQEEVPDMIVFSDMQFDAAEGGYSYNGSRGGGSWQTTHERIEAAFDKLGREICGQPYEPPRIIYWNIRGNSSSGIHAPVQADHANVQMLSGYSAALMKLVLAGEFEEEIIEQEEVVDGVVVVTKVKKKITPFDTFRKAVEDKCFDRIRAVLTRSNEDIFAHYNWMKEDSGDENRPKNA